MVCPRCKGEMTELNKYGAMIDTCLECGGIWLDKNELGQVMSYMRQAESALDQEVSPPRRGDQERHDDRHYSDNEAGHEDHGHHDKHRHKRSFFDIFD